MDNPVFESFLLFWKSCSVLISWGTFDDQREYSFVIFLMADEESEIVEIQRFKLNYVWQGGSGWTLLSVQVLYNLHYDKYGDYRMVRKLGRLGKNLFTFQLFNWKDLEKVLQGEAWWFNKKILVLCELKGEEQPSSLNPSCTLFWVTIYDIPFNLRTGQKNWECHR